MVEEKDWKRMYDLIVDGKDGASVARSIKQKDKAIARYVAGLKLLSLNPDDMYHRGVFTGFFSDFGNKAIELGADLTDIRYVYDNCPNPEELINKIKGYLNDTDQRARIPDNFFKELRNYKVDVLTEELNRLPTQAAYDATANKKNKEIIPFKITFYVNKPQECYLDLDIIVDLNGGSNSYILKEEYNMKTDLTGVFGYQELYNAVWNEVITKKGDN